MVINGYLPMFSKEANLVYFFRSIVGVQRITKEILRGRSQDYQQWVEGYALNHGIPIKWAEKGVRKADWLTPYLKRFLCQKSTGVYYILKSMEQSTTFRVATEPGKKKRDPNHRQVSRCRSCFTHYYFYLVDEIAGPMVLRVGSFLPFTISYYLNGHSFIERELLKRGIDFRKKDNLFVTVKEPEMLQKAADGLSAESIAARLNYWSFLLGPKFSRKQRTATIYRRKDGTIFEPLERFYAINQLEYCRNFIFKDRFPLKSLFERSCELSLYQLLPTRVSNLFGKWITRRYKGKLQSVLQRKDDGRHVFRFHWKDSLLKQYHKELQPPVLRNELASNYLYDLGLRKSLKYLPEIKEKFSQIVDRFADFQADTLSVRPECNLFQALSQPVILGKRKVAGIKLEHTRVVRLMEILLYSGATMKTWTTRQIHEAILSRFQIKPTDLTLCQLRYDMGKLRAHGLLIRQKGKYSYQLTNNGNKTALMFCLFRKRVYGPIAGSLFLHRPVTQKEQRSKVERAYQQIDRSIDRLLYLIAA
jgi:hypothetical protein